MSALEEMRLIQEFLDASPFVVPTGELPVHVVEQAARSMLEHAVSRAHYDEGLLEELGDIRMKTFREPGEQHPFADALDQARFVYTNQLRRFMDGDRIAVCVNNLDVAKLEEPAVYELCRKIRFLHDTACQLLHWI